MNGVVEGGKRQEPGSKTGGNPTRGERSGGRKWDSKVAETGRIGKIFCNPA